MVVRKNVWHEMRLWTAQVIFYSSLWLLGGFLFSWVFLNLITTMISKGCLGLHCDLEKKACYRKNCDYFKFVLIWCVFTL